MTRFWHGLAALALLLPSLAHAADPSAAKAAPTTDPAAFIAEDPALSSMIGRVVPALSMTTLNGQTLDLAQLTQKGPVYLKLWATYCIPCRAQMPGFERLYQRYQSRMSVVAVDIGFGEKRDSIAAFVKKAGLTMPVAVDDGSLSNWLQIRATPLHVLIDRNGRLAYLGHQDGVALEAALERVMATPRMTGDRRFSGMNRAPVLATGARIPAIALTDAFGNKTALRPGSTAQPQVILFTAPWCESYLATMDPPTAHNCASARALAQRLAGQSGLVWTIIGARLWSEQTDMPAFQTLFGPRFHVRLDSNNEAFTWFGIRQIPAIALVTREGHVARILEGSRPDLAAQLEAFTRNPG